MGEAKARAQGNSAAAVRVSEALQGVAHGLDERLTEIAGERVTFSLFVWTEGRANYISNAADRDQVAGVLRKMLEGWDAGMPDIPAHEVRA